jgi:hypothetical protein
VQVAVVVPHGTTPTRQELAALVVAVAVVETLAVPQREPQILVAVAEEHQALAVPGL